MEKNILIASILLLVLFSGNLLANGYAGTYTINSNEPTEGTNFSSFSDMAFELGKEGIAGPVILNVTEGSGPYTEQVIINNISGVSEVNTITINGNGETLSYLSTSDTQRATLKIIATSYITINNLVIIALATGDSPNHRGYAVQLMNNANHNTFTNCQFIVSKTSAAQHFAAFVASNSNSNPLFASTAVNNLTIDNCIAIGGYFGIVINGPELESTSPIAQYNKITNTVIKDFRNFGIRFLGQNNGLISKNKISRPTRTQLGFYYGIWVGQDMTGTHITKNRFYDMAVAATSNIGAQAILGGGQFSVLEAQQGQELIIANNLIHGFQGINNEQRGIYLLNANHIKVYHNTIFLDHANHPSSGGISAISHSGDNNVIDVRNNIIYLNSNSQSSKYGLDFRSSDAQITSDNNVIYMGLPAENKFTARWGSTSYTSLAEWQTANESAFDQNSTNVSPLFQNSVQGDLTPENPEINNMGANLLVIVPDDFYDVERTETPDPGAIEFDPPECSPPSEPAVVNIAFDSATLTWNATGEEDEWNIEWGPAGFVQGEGTIIEGITQESYLLEGLTEATSYSFYVQANCGQGNYSTWSGPTQFNTLCLVISDFPFTENFNNEFPPICWDFSGGSRSWSSYIQTDTLNTVALANFWAWPSGSDAMMTLPVMNLSLLDEPGMFFKWSSQFSALYPDDELNILISIDGGINWNSIWYKSGPDLFSDDGATNTLPGSFITEMVDLSYYNAHQEAIIRFHASGSGPNLFVDDIIIMDIQTGSLAGTVTLFDGQPVEGARISCGDYSTYTNGNGEYLIQDILHGLYSVICLIPNNSIQATDSISIVSNEITQVNFTFEIAQIAINPDSLEETLFRNQTATHFITLSNEQGTLPLEWTAFDKPLGEANLFDLLGYFSIGTGEYSVATDGEHIYTKIWNTPLIHRYSMMGIHQGSFTIDGVEGGNDMAWDGEYFYMGSAQENKVYVLDLKNETLIDQIITPEQRIRALAYDKDNDAFWLTYHWGSEIHLVDRSGETLQSFFTDVPFITGLAWENTKSIEPALWAYAQPGMGQRNILYKLNPQTGEILLNFNVESSGAIQGQSFSGGLHITNLIVPGKWILLGVSSGNVVWALELDLDSPQWLSFHPQSGVLPAGEAVEIEVVFESGTMNIDTYQAEIIFNHNGFPFIDKSVPVTFNVTEPKYTVDFIINDSQQLPVNDAIVTLGNTTNPAGNYTFTEIPAGSYSYQVVADGYTTIPGTVNVLNQDVTVNITLLSTDIDKLSATSLSVYPLPADNILNINSEIGILEIRVYTSTGHLILNRQYDNTNSLVIDVGDHKPGIYFLTILTTDGLLVNRIMIISR